LEVFCVAFLGSRGHWWDVNCSCMIVAFAVAVFVPAIYTAEFLELCRGLSLCYRSGGLRSIGGIDTYLC
jgi:hypothetical protein